jgi:hypothetical protein
LNARNSSGVSRNSIGACAVAALGAMLSQNKVLSELDIGMAELFGDTIPAVAAGLRDNTTLHILNLSNNKVTTKGFVTLLRHLKQTQLREFTH